MTNEVEKRIIEEFNPTPITIKEEKNAYLLYKEIWEFILHVINYDFEELSIRFDIEKRNNKYFINKEKGIKYELRTEDFKDSWKTFYMNCNNSNIIRLLNESIDIRLFFNLLYNDGIYHNYLDDEKMLVYVSITKKEILDLVKSVLKRNKKLLKEV